MTDWWTYRLDDLIAFSPRVYWRLFELHNADLWPLHLAAAGAAAAAAVPALRHGDGRWLAALLAVLWAGVGWSFLWTRYATVNWPVAYVAPAFAAQAALLLAAAARGLAVDRDSRIGLALAAGGLAYPLAAPLFGRPWPAAEAFGIAPDPTAIATLGLLVAARGGLAPLLLPVPVAWLLVSGLTLSAMADRQAWLPLAAAVAALAARAVTRRARP